MSLVNQIDIDKHRRPLYAGRMSLKPTNPQRSFYHISTLCGEMFGATDRYRLFREKILPKLFALRGKLESLYCENNGRPAVDPVLLAGVTLLQFKVCGSADR